MSALDLLDAYLNQQGQPFPDPGADDGDGDQRGNTFAKLVAAVRGFESGGRPDAVSPQKAYGSMQIQEPTFRRYALPGESFDNDVDRTRAAIRKLADDYQHYGYDVRKTAAAYIGGRGGVLPDGTLREDVRDAFGTTPRAYADIIAGRMAKMGLAPSLLNMQSASAAPVAPDLADEVLAAGVNAIRKQPAPPPESAGVMRTVGDMGIKLAQGAVDLGQSVVGLGSLATGGLVGKGMRAIGYDPEATNQFLGQYLSPSQRAAEQAVQNSDGMVDAIVQSIQHPRSILGGAAESLPGMLAGMGLTGAVARGIGLKAALATTEGALARDMALQAGKTEAQAAVAALQSSAGRQAAADAIDAAAARLMALGSASEGAQSAGQIADQAQQQGRDWSQYALPATAAGALTAGIGYGAGRLMGDVGTDIATGARTVKGKLPTRLAKEAFSEGVLEEAPQSAQEQFFTNVATGEPDLSKGVGQQAGVGAVVGGTMGAGMGLVHRPAGPLTRAAQAAGAGVPGTTTQPPGTVPPAVPPAATPPAAPPAAPAGAASAVRTAPAVPVGPTTLGEVLAPAENAAAAYDLADHGLPQLAAEARHAAEVEGLQQRSATESLNARLPASQASASQRGRMEVLNKVLDSLPPMTPPERKLAAFSAQLKREGYRFTAATPDEMEYVANHARVADAYTSTEQEYAAPNELVDAVPERKALAPQPRRKAAPVAPLPPELLPAAQQAKDATAFWKALNRAGIPQGQRAPLMEAFKAFVKSGRKLPAQAGATSVDAAAAQQADTAPAAAQEAEAGTVPSARTTANDDGQEVISPAGAAPVIEEPVADLSGQNTDNEWHAFPPESGTLGIPREDMPQIKAEHRGALTQFLKARGISHEQEEVRPSSLKPTQREFSIDKVDQAQKHDGGDRALLVSSDNHILDGHHQWLGKLDEHDVPVRVIRFNAPIRELLPEAAQFPSAEADEGARTPAAPPDAAAPPVPTLSIGKTPNSAEPVTVKDGVIHIGTYPAQDFDTGADIRVPDGATPQQIKTALVQGKAIGHGNKIFGMPKGAEAEQAAAQPGTAAEQVPAPNAADDLDAQIRAAGAHLIDVLTDITGSKLKATGPQYSTADLLPALSKLIGLLIQKGARSFAAAVSGTARALRGLPGGAAAVDQISARQWKAGYNAVAEAYEGTDSEDAVHAVPAEQVLRLVAGEAAPSTRFEALRAKLREHGLTAEEAQEMRRLDPAYPAPEAIAAKAHATGIPADFLASMPGFWNPERQAWDYSDAEIKAIYARTQAEHALRSAYGDYQRADSARAAIEQAVLDEQGQQAGRVTARGSGTEARLVAYHDEVTRRLQAEAARIEAERATEGTFEHLLAQKRAAAAADERTRFMNKAALDEARADAAELDALLAEGFVTPEENAALRTATAQAADPLDLAMLLHDAVQKAEARKGATKARQAQAPANDGRAAAQQPAAQAQEPELTTQQLNRLSIKNMTDAQLLRAQKELPKRAEPVAREIERRRLSTASPAKQEHSPTRDDIANRYAAVLAEGKSHRADATEFHQRFADAILAKDAFALKWITNGLNGKAKQVFSEFTGVKLPKQQGKSWDAIKEWAGVTPEQDAAFNARVDAANTAKRQEADDKWDEQVAANHKYKVSADSDDTISAKEVVDRWIAEGYNEIANISKTPIPKYALVNRNASRYYPLDKVSKRYAELALRRLQKSAEVGTADADHLQTPEQAAAAQAEYERELADAKAKGQTMVSDEDAAHLFGTSKAPAAKAEKPYAIVPRPDGKYVLENDEAIEAQGGSPRTFDSLAAAEAWAKANGIPVNATPARGQGEVAQHVEGQQTEPATAPVIAQSLEKAAARTPLNYKTAKAELLAKIDAAISAAPEQGTATNAQDDELHAAARGLDEAREAQRIGKGDRQQLNAAVAQAEQRLVAARKAVQYLEFDVPGDGKFTVLNKRANLQDFKKRVLDSKGFDPLPKRRGSASSRTLGVSESPTQAIRDMLKQGEQVAAYELAKTIGEPFRFTPNAKDGVPNLYIDARDIHDMTHGIQGYVGRLYVGTKAGSWYFIEKNTGQHIGDPAASAAAAEKNARDKLAKTNPDTLANAIHKFANTVPDQAALEAAWLAAAEKSDDEYAAKLDAEAKSAERQRAVKAEQDRLDAERRAKDAADRAASPEGQIEAAGFAIRGTSQRLAHGNGVEVTYPGSQKIGQISLYDRNKGTYRAYVGTVRSMPDQSLEQAIAWLKNWYSDEAKAKAPKAAAPSVAAQAPAGAPQAEQAERSIEQVEQMGRDAFAAGEPRENGRNMKLITDVQHWMRGWDEAKADADAKAAGKVALPSEFPTKEVAASYSGISHQGDGRARSDRDAYVQTAQELYDEAKALAETPAQQEALDGAISRFKREYIEETNRLAKVRSGAYSGFVAGRSGLNSRQANSRNGALDRAQDRFSDWLKGAAPKVKQAVLAARSPEQLAAIQRAKDEKATAAQARNDEFLRKLLAFKPGGAPLAVGKSGTLERVNYGKDGLPSSLNISGDGLIKGVTDKLELVPMLYKSKEELAAAVARVRAARPVTATGILQTATRTTRIPGMEGEAMADPVARDILAAPGIDKLDAALAAHGVSVTGLAGAGTGSVVLDAGDKVVRLGVGEATPVPQVEGVLQPLASGNVGAIRYDIMPKADTSEITAADVQQVADRLAAQGYEFSDAGIDNVGKLDGVPVVIDPGAVRKAAPPRAPWQIPSWEFTRNREANPFFDQSFRGGDSEYLRAVQAYHEQAVKDALARGEKVPAEVLADYPELAPTAASAAAPQQADDRISAEQAKKQMTWRDLGQRDGVTTHKLMFNEDGPGDGSSSITISTVQRIGSGKWQVDDAPERYDGLRDAKKAATEAGLRYLREQGYVTKEAAAAAQGETTPAEPQHVFMRSLDAVMVDGTTQEAPAGWTGVALDGENSNGGYVYVGRGGKVTRLAASDFEAAQREAAALAVPETPAEQAAKSPVDVLGLMNVAEQERTEQALYDGELSLDALKANFQRLLASEAAIKAELNGKQKKDLLAQGGLYFAHRHKNENKADIVDQLYDQMLHPYTLSQTVSYTLGGSYRAAMTKVVDRLTQENLDQFREKVRQQRAEARQQVEQHAAALTDPQTAEDFDTMARERMAEYKREHPDATSATAFLHARLSMTPEQRARYDELKGIAAREQRAARKVEKQEQVLRAPGEPLTTTETIQTKHGKYGHDLWQFQIEQRVSTEEYKRLSDAARRLGGDYSGYRGQGAIPGWQFKTPEGAAAFKALLAGDTDAAKEHLAARRDAFADDRSQRTEQRLREMADSLEAQADEVAGRDRKTNTARRASHAAAADAFVRQQRATALTMRALAAAIEEGRAKFLDRVRAKTQIELLDRLADTARDRAADAEFPVTQGEYGRWSRPAGYEKRLQARPTVADMDHAEWPTYTAYRSDLAPLGRQLLEIDGTKLLGQQVLKVANDVSAAYEKFAKSNFHKVAAFSNGKGELAAFANKMDAEEAIRRNGYKGKAIVLAVKRGQNAIILSPSEARARGIWQGDDDARITLDPELGRELVEKLGKINRFRNRVTVPWVLETAHDRRKALARMNIETPAELRAALREYMGLYVMPQAPDKIKELERKLFGRSNDGLDFFPTPAAQADEMIEVAGLQAGMRVLEPSAGWGNIADQIRAAGVEPDVVEMAQDRRELLEAKGYDVVGRDFLDMKEAVRGYTYGDLMKAPDGTVGILRGSGGMGSDRVRLVDENDPQKNLGYYSYGELEGVELRGTGSGYDRILMNPPFSDRRDAAHVMHAYDLLKPGGRLVAIMGEGVFFGQDKKAQAFRDWLEAHGGSSEKLAEGTFMDPSLPVNTSVNARLVVVDKPGGADMRLEQSREVIQYAPGEDLYDGVEVRPGTTEAQKETGRAAVADLARLLGVDRIERGSRTAGEKVSVLGARLLANFIAARPNQLVGQVVQTARDLAALAQVYRDPRFETFRVFYMGGGKVVGEAGYTSRLPGSVVLPEGIDKLIDADMGRFGASSYYLLHNHPSGRADPSASDERLTSRLAAAVPGFRGHVILDHNEYGLINTDLDSSVVAAPELDNVDFTATPAVAHPLLGQPLHSPLQMALAAKGMQSTDGHATLIMLTKGRTVVQLVVDLPLAAIRSMRTDSGADLVRAKALIRRMARAMGAGGPRVIVLPPGVAVDEPPFRRLMHNGVVVDVVSADGKDSLYALDGGDGGDFLDENEKSVRVAEPNDEGYGGGVVVDGVKRAATDSTGQPLGSTPGEIQAFWRWFGDSKAVDEQGRPLVQYHGTGDAAFDQFTVPAFFTEDPSGAQWFATDRSDDGTGGRLVTAYLSIKRPMDISTKAGAFAFIDLAHAAGVEIAVTEHRDGSWDFETGAIAEHSPYEGTNLTDLVYVPAVRAKLEESGYDGVFAMDTLENTEIPAWIALQPDQIRHIGDIVGQVAVDNSGTFDPANPNVLGNAPVFYSALARTVPEMAKIANKDGMVQPALARKWLAARQKEGKFKAEELEWSGVDDWLKLLKKDKVAVADIVRFVEKNGVQVQESIKGGDRAADGGLLTPQQDLYLREFSDRWEAAESAADGGKRDESALTALSEEYGKWLEDNHLPQMSADELLAENRAARDEAADSGVRFPTYTLPGGANYHELLLTLPERKPKNFSFNDWSERLYGERWPFPIPAERKAEYEEKFARFLQDHDRAMDDAARNFKTAHWSEKNVVAHVRFNDRLDDDGKRVLFLEELQSDWGQQGRKRGFRGALPTRASLEAKGVTFAQIGSKWEAYFEGGQIAEGDTLSEAIRQVVQDTEPEFAAEVSGVPSGPFVTDTKAWVALALKRMIRYAAEHGYDKVAFVNGDQVVERFDLAQHIRKIDWHSQGGKFSIKAYGRSGDPHRPVIDVDNLTADELDEYVGPEVAARIVQEASRKKPKPDYEVTKSSDARRPVWYVKSLRSGFIQTLFSQEAVDQFLAERSSGPIVTGSLSRLNVQAGGRGMRVFYDEIVPQVANEVLKKLGGGKVGVVNIPADAHDEARGDYYDPGDMVWRTEDDEPLSGRALAQPGFDITPALREQALAGLPLFDQQAGAPLKSALDQTLYGMVRDGSSAADLLHRIAAGSANPEYRAMAERLLALGVDPEVRLGEPGAGGLNGAEYNADLNRIDLYEPYDTERHLLHEFTHAATYRALRTKGRAAQQMKALYANVKRSNPALAGSYGMNNVDEFVAEAHSNPAFQAALVAMRDGPRSLWQRFLDIVRRILGLPERSATVLDSVLKAGRRLMAENQRAQAAAGAVGNVGQRAEAATRPATWRRLAQLEWERGSANMITAELADGSMLNIYEDYEGAELTHLDGDDGRELPIGEGEDAPHSMMFDSVDEAKRAAQAEYERVYARQFGIVPPGLRERETLAESITVDGVARPTVNSAGQQIAATAEAVRNFWHWFGDSKRVDEQGRPEVLYQYDAGPEGVYVTPNKVYAEMQASGGPLVPVYVRTTKPISFDDLSLLEGPDDLLALGAAAGEAVRGTGFDAVEQGSFTLVLPDRAQVKSATDNLGTFDPGTPHILGNLSARFNQTVREAANNINGVRLPADYVLGDFLSGHGKVHWWHKTIGTMDNLARRSPAFAQVYRRVQQFLNDVSRFANQAADAAPTLLPQLATWRDIIGRNRKKAVSAEDSRAIAAPIFEGTLLWTRDGAGRPVKLADLEDRAATMSTADMARELIAAGEITEEENQGWQNAPGGLYNSTIRDKYGSAMLQAGIVFTEAELHDLFGLNPRQIGLYHEFRAAVDKSLTNLTITEMVRMGGKHTDGTLERLLEADNLAMASAMLQAHFTALAAQDPENAGLYARSAQAVANVAKKGQRLMDKGYAPLMRFGRYTVYVTEGGQQMYFGMYENRADANRMARRMRELHPEARVTQGTLSEEEYKQFADMSPETLEMFGAILGLRDEEGDAADLAFQTFLKRARDNRSALKRLIHRKGVAGFSEDAGRVLAAFLYSNARRAAANAHQGEVDKAISEIPARQGELKDAAMRLREHVWNPRKSTFLSGLMFAQFLGGSLASAAVNITQPLTMTLPFLAQYGGLKPASDELLRAVRDAARDSTGDPELDRALKWASDQGIVAPQEVHYLIAQAAGRATLRAGDGSRSGNAQAMAHNALTALRVAWGKPFEYAELKNRTITFIAAYRTARREGLPNAERFAADAVAQTQMVYNSGNRPEWARSPIGGLLMTFKQYSVGYLELLARLAFAGKPGSPERAAGRRAALYMVAVLFLMSGLDGLPFEQDLEDAIDGLLQRLGYNFSSKRAKQALLADVLGAGGADFALKGISALPGMPLDFAGRFSMSNLIPGTGLLKKKEDYTRDLGEIVGPAGDLAKRAFTASGKALGGNVGGAVVDLSPLAVRNLVQGVDMLRTGSYNDARGYKLNDTTPLEGAMKIIGFQPNSTANIQEAKGQALDLIAQTRLRSREIAERWAQGRANNDEQMVAEARAMRDEWNRKNPDTPIRVDMPGVMRRARAMRENAVARTQKTAGRGLKDAVKRELGEVRE